MVLVLVHYPTHFCGSGSVIFFHIWFSIQEYAKNERLPPKRCIAVFFTALNVSIFLEGTKWFGLGAKPVSIPFSYLPVYKYHGIL